MKLSEKVYLIDTNVILRYLLDDHESFSPKAKAFMLKVSEGVRKAEIGLYKVDNLRITAPISSKNVIANFRIMVVLDTPDDQGRAAAH